MPLMVIIISKRFLRWASALMSATARRRMRSMRLSLLAMIVLSSARRADGLSLLLVSACSRLRTAVASSVSCTRKRS